MQTIRSVYRLPLLLLALLLPAIAAAAPPPPAPTIASSQSLTSRPRTDGRFVVWHDSAGPDAGRLMALDLLNGGQPFLLTNLISPNAASDGVTWDISNGIVVWGDYRAESDSWNVYGKDLNNGEDLVIAASGASEAHPRVSGRTVVYLSIGRSASSYGVIKARSLDAAAAVDVLRLEAEWGLHDLLFDSGRVMVHERKCIRTAICSWRLRVAEIGGPPSVVATGDGWLLGIDFAGEIVAYVEHTDHDRLHVLNVNSGEQRLLAAANALGPTTDGRFVFWSAREREDYDVKTAALMAYDLDTDSRFLAVPGGVAHYSLHLRNDRLVWAEGSSPLAIKAALLASLLPSGRRNPPQPGSATAYFPETAHTLSGVFKTFWEQRGGLGVFGYPLTEEYQEQNRDLGRFLVTQYLERQRFEHHPEQAGTPYEVLLGRLGVEALQQQGRDWRSFPKGDPSVPYYFEQTGHAIAPQFSDYWRSHGLEFGDAGVSFREALALFGYPISEPQLETNADGDTVLTQWFERARFEYHPNNPDPYKVLLGRLGAEVFAGRGW